MGCCASTGATPRELSDAPPKEVKDRAPAQNHSPARAVGARGSPWVLKTSPGLSGGWWFRGDEEYKEVERRGGRGTIRNAIADFKAHPDKYVAMRYWTDAHDEDWEEQTCTLFHRPTKQSSSLTCAKESGDWTVLEWKCRPLRPDVEVKDDGHEKLWLQSYKYEGETVKTRGVSPGRGQGLADVQSLCLWNKIDPNDLNQRGVGNCYMIAVFAALAEWPGAIKKLFRKTKGADEMPRSNAANEYTITLYDLESAPVAREVDVVVNERLAVDVDSGDKLGVTISDCCELWPCYLEKALVAHCGGWNDIGCGGISSQVLEILTGCPNTYVMNFKDFECCGNSAGAKRSNSVQKRFAMAQVGEGFSGKPWPSANGKPVVQPKTQDGCIDALYAYDKANYPMVFAGAEDEKTAEAEKNGYVDGHVYTLIRVEKNVAGSGIDMLLVRNPWGNGELTRGKFVDDGPGWKEHPKIQKALRPVFEDDGAFWLEKSEFFEYVDSIEILALDMTTFVKSSYKPPPLDYCPQDHYP